MSCIYRRPTRAQYLDFLLGKGDLEACLQKAYRDFCRTVKKGVKRPDWLMNEFVNLPSRVSNQEEFDQWHRSICNHLGTVETGTGEHLSIGHAQKWVNMTLKYIFAFGEEQIPGYEKLYELAHMPLDKKILDCLKREVGADADLSTAWSKLLDYEEYFNVQEKIREKFPECAPMTLEFYWWQGQPGQPAN